MDEYNIFFGKLDSNNNKEILWSIETDNIELIAGMMAAGAGITTDMNNSYFVDSDADLSSFRKVKEVPEDEITKKSCGALESNEYGLWLKGYKPFHYSLYGFQTPSFFQGIVSMCNAFEVDFRNYIYGLPFDSRGNQYAFGGYVMTPYQVVQDAPDLDDDFDDNPDEDENIIQKLERTDDIITDYDIAALKGF